MKKIGIFSIVAFVLSLTMALSSCQLIGDIFKAGVWVGVIMVVGVIGLIMFLISRIGGK
jgi:hypothetical protein